MSKVVLIMKLKQTLGIAFVLCVGLSALKINAATDSENNKRLNDITIIGSHNSYKRKIPVELLAHIENHNAKLARSINYYHYDLYSQLDSGLRQLEIDVLADPDGGLYENPLAIKILKEFDKTIGEQQGFYQNAMLASGMKVLHIPDIDLFTHCATFQLCMQQINNWSDENPAHEPLFILINIKENAVDWVNGVKPIIFDSAMFDKLDAEILEVLPREKLLLPDDVRGKSKSLKQAVTTNGWPALEDSRGKIIFIFDGKPRQANIYREGHSSLSGRVMFAAFDESQQEAAIMVVNKPIEEQERIKRLVTEGFIVRTRSDAGMNESPEQMLRRYQAAVSSGAQIISSDFYPGSPNREIIDYALPR